MRAPVPAILAAAIVVFFSAETSERAFRFSSVMTILGPCCGDGGNDLVVDPDGGVWVAGFRGGLDLDRDGNVDIDTMGSPEPLVMKYFDDERENREHGWVDESGGPGHDFARSVALDRSGGAVVAGVFNDHIRFGRTTLYSEGRADIFLARYSATGRVIWVRGFGGPGDDELMHAESDKAGNIYIAGTVRSPVDLDADGNPDVDTEGSSAMLMASFDTDGKLRWARTTAGNAAARGTGITVAPDGAIYASGFYHMGAIDIDADGTIDVAPPGMRTGSEQPAPPSDIDSFYIKFSADGELLWTKTVTGPSVQIAGTPLVAENGDILVPGGYMAPPDLNADGEPDLEFRSLSEHRWEHGADMNTFLLRVSPEGELLWARRYMISATHLANSGNGILMTGSYTGPLDIDDDGTLERDADPDKERESCVAILDERGHLRQTLTIVGVDSDIAAAAGITPDGRILYVTGYTKLGADFDGDGKVEFASACHQIGDIFIARYELSSD